MSSDFRKSYRDTGSAQRETPRDRAIRELENGPVSSRQKTKRLRELDYTPLSSRRSKLLRELDYTPLSSRRSKRSRNFEDENSSSDEKEPEKAFDDPENTRCLYDDEVSKLIRRFKRQDMYFGEVYETSVFLSHLDNIIANVIENNEFKYHMFVLAVELKINKRKPLENQVTHHYALLVLDFGSEVKKATIYDPLERSSNMFRAHKDFLKVVKQTCSELMDTDIETRVFMPGQQEDDYNCGILVAAAIEYLSRQGSNADVDTLENAVFESIVPLRKRYFGILFPQAGHAVSVPAPSRTSRNAMPVPAPSRASRNYIVIDEDENDEESDKREKKNFIKLDTRRNKNYM